MNVYLNLRERIYPPNLFQRQAPVSESQDDFDALDMDDPALNQALGIQTDLDNHLRPVDLGLANVG